MGRALYANNYATTLASSITAAATSLTVATGTGASAPSPSGGDYVYLTLVDAATKAVIEIVQATARSGDTFTVVRGQQGTTASAYAAGDLVSINVTSSGLNELVPIAAVQAQTYTAFATAGTAPNFTLTPNPAITGYSTNQRFNVPFHAGGTTGSNTLAISGLPAKNLKQYDGTGAKQPGVIISGMVADIVFDGTDLVILNPVVTNAHGIGATTDSRWASTNLNLIQFAGGPSLWSAANSNLNIMVGAYSNSGTKYLLSTGYGAVFNMSATSGTAYIRTYGAATADAAVSVAAAFNVTQTDCAMVTANGALGYGGGAGGTVTQATSRTTAVTLNKPTGQITLFTAAGTSAWTTFTVNNSLVTTADVPDVAVQSSTNTYIAKVTAVAAGAFNISFSAISGTASDAPVLNFVLHRGSAS